MRADSGFARDELMAWCEANGVHFLFGLAKNDRLIAMIVGELAQRKLPPSNLSCRRASRDSTRLRPRTDRPSTTRPPDGPNLLSVLLYL